MRMRDLAVSVAISSTPLFGGDIVAAFYVVLAHQPPVDEQQRDFRYRAEGGGYRPPLQGAVLLRLHRLLRFPFYRLISEGHDARAEGLRLRKCEVGLVAQAVEEALAAPQNHGMYHEPELVEQDRKSVV